MKYILVIKIFIHQLVNCNESSSSAYTSTAMNQDGLLAILLDLHGLLDQVHQDLGAVRSSQICPFLGLEMVHSQGRSILSVDVDSSKQQSFIDLIEMASMNQTYL